MPQIKTIRTSSDDMAVALEELRARLSPRGHLVTAAGRQRTIDVFGQPLTPEQVVDQICADVKNEGITAVLDYGRRLDDADLEAGQLKVSPSELAAAHAAADPDFLATVRRIRQNILEFQEAVLHQNVEVTRPNGTRLRQRYLPLRRAGLCIPGGTAAYPSSVLMTAVPAQAAGVKELAACAPPTKYGANNPDILATCHELGIQEVYRVEENAQAVAALAYGIDGLPAVDKIVGPGNLFVALAKKRVYGEVDIDSIAGPSEVVVLADETTSPEFTAADLLAQAEHAPGVSLLVTWHEPTLTHTVAALEQQLGQLPRAELTCQSLAEFAALILVRDRAEACEITNLIAPEHLHISASDPESLLASIYHAGAVFLGPFSPVAVGDYIAGPSHVLPTGGTARWASGLSANDFLRSGSIIEFGEPALREAAPDIQRIAQREQLTAHWASVAIRTEGPPTS